MYTIAICDAKKEDTISLKSSVSNVLNGMNIPHLVHLYENELNLYQVILKNPEQYNVIFLDTSLSHLPGIQFAYKLREKHYKGVLAFTSDTCDYVFDGYEVNAEQYFIKPISQDKLKRFYLQAAKKDRQLKSSQHLVLNCGSSYHRILYADILYMETFGHKIAIHTNENTVYYSCKLTDMEELLPKELFMRCHQSYLLQIENIAYITRTYAHLKNGIQIPISRSHKDVLKNLLIFCRK